MENSKPAASTNPAPADARQDPPISATLPDHPGCMMVVDLNGGEPIEFGAQPCGEATNPASTFKVPHAVFALETGAVSGPDEVVPWDGTKQWLKVWERDQTLRSAVHDSVVWYFQRTAKKIGQTEMTRLLESFDYGNADPSSAIDRFWLGGGSLKISGEEKLEFMRRLYRDELPAKPENLALVRELVLRPPTSFKGRMLPDHVVPPTADELRFGAKTGTAMLDRGSVTWLVGHRQCPDGGPGHVFVSRVISEDEASAKSPAATFGLEALAALGLLDC
ncbi:MAG: penicillin-binding transpeptidase domain-containing protein [Myxococcota bacterium]